MKQILKIYTLDDDPVILGGFTDALTGYLQTLPDYEAHVTRFTSGQSLFQHLDHAKALDLLLTDIDLGDPAIDGIAVARRVRERFPQCAVIYLTAYMDYATEIFETEPLYFILKDQYRQRIPRAMELFFQKYSQNRETITVTCGREKQVVPLGDILYLQHTDRRTLIFTKTQLLDVGDTIPELLKQLPEDRFVQCHRSYIVALKQVRQFRRFDLQLFTGEVIPISRAKYEGFRRAFEDSMQIR